MGAPYSAKSVANYFLELASSKGQGLSPMKLQKLVYFAHGWHLALFHKPLIDERVQAWRYGPVIPSVYHEFKRFGAQSITGTATDLDKNGLYLPLIPEEDKQTRAFLNRIWDVYAKFSGVQLSNMTHAPGSPWAIAWDEGGGMPEVAINDEMIRDHFVAKSKKN